MIISIYNSPYWDRNTTNTITFPALCCSFNNQCFSQDIGMFDILDHNFKSLLYSTRISCKESVVNRKTTRFRLARHWICHSFSVPSGISREKSLGIVSTFTHDILVECNSHSENEVYSFSFCRASRYILPLYSESI